MPTYPRIAAAVAAIAIVAIGGIYLFGHPGGSGVGGPVATPSPSPSAASTPTASPKTISSLTFRPAVRFQAPADWVVDADVDRAFVLSMPAASPVDFPSINVMRGPFVQANDPDCGGRAAAGVGGSTAEITASISTDPRLVTVAAGAFTIGDQVGQAIDVKLAASWTGTCTWSEGKPALLLHTATDTGPAFGIAGTDRSRLILLDVGDSVVSIVITSGAGFDTFVAGATPIIEAMQFTP